MSEEPSAYGFVCENENCLAIMVIYPHPESPGLPDPFANSVPADEPMWERHWPDCPACDERMELETGDPVSHVIKRTEWEKR